ncbi:MAG: NfeD family protein [Treponema sp.]|nr:NfeD family protein [Treponema sp.]
MMEFITSNLPWFWLIVLIACCTIEAFTMGLTTIWAGIAALPMIFIALTGLPFRWQLLIFVILTVLLIIFTRPFAVKKLKNGKEKTNVNTLCGEEVLITKKVTKFEKGEAKAKNGVVWTTKSSNDEEIAEGTICKIVEVQGNTIIVEPINK